MIDVHTGIHDGLQRRMQQRRSFSPFNRVVARSRSDLLRRTLSSPSPPPLDLFPTDVQMIALAGENYCPCRDLT